MPCYANIHNSEITGPPDRGIIEDEECVVSDIGCFRVETKGFSVRLCERKLLQQSESDFDP